MSRKIDSVKNNPVAKNMNEFCKPKTFRDRKKHPSKEMQRQERADRIGELVHPKQAPYKRDKKILPVEDEIDDDLWDSGMAWDE